MGLKVCVLQPDYSTSNVDYQYYDPPRDLSSLIPDAQVDHVLINKLTTYKQLLSLKEKQYDIYVNLCEGYLEWEVPSIDVIHTLDLLNLPYTGPTANLYDPPKELMKYVAYCEGVKTPSYHLVRSLDDIQGISATFPLFVKPSKAGDSLGIDQSSLIHNKEELLTKVDTLLKEYPELLVEEYIDGREFTVLVAAKPEGKGCVSFKPVEYIFPEGFRFKTYSLKTSELHPGANIPCDNIDIENELRKAAEKIFNCFSGKGYARLDFRMNAKGEIFFLEINFTCSVFYTEGLEGSADFILNYDGIGKSGFLKHIIAEGIARHKRKQKAYAMKGNSIAGYGIYATRLIKEGEIIYRGEERAHRIVTKKHVEQHWNEEEEMNFKRYAYPISDTVFAIWDEEPGDWAPQNHSCDPNTRFDGLNTIAIKDIHIGEELTFDYATFLDKEMEPFQCQCGSSNCRGLIKAN